jgi:multiple sugar transport system permease protein
MATHWTPGRVITVGILLLLSGIYLMPLYWMVTGSFEPVTNTLKVPPDFFPPNPTAKNYNDLFDGTLTVLWFFNSCLVAGVASICAVFTSSTAGYALGTKRFPGSNVLFYVVVISLALPSAVTIVPLFLIMRDLGWINTYAGLIAPDIAYPFGVFLMRQFMHTVPRELFDAAKVDGASEIQVFTRIVLPLTRPALGAIAIFAFINSWTNYIWQVVIINSEELQTLPVGIAKLASGYQDFNLGLAMAGATVAFLPMLLIFLFFQGYFTKGITTGALKG